MDKIFGLDSPFMRTLGVIADLMLLNVLTILCSLPVITAGAAFTALHYCCLKISRDEENYIIRMYFHSFRQNLLQSIPLWLVFLLVAAGYAYDFRAVNENLIPRWFFYAGTAAFVLFSFVYVWVFPLLSRFDNKNSVTVKNACIIAVTKLPRTLLMTGVVILAALLCTPAFIGVDIFIRVLPVIFLFSFSAPAYICAKIYNPVFMVLENPATPEPDSSATPESSATPDSPAEPAPATPDSSATPDSPPNP